VSRALALAALAVAAVLFASAAALAATSGTPPGLPTVTIPTVSAPAVTIPSVSTPAVTTPVVTVPPVTVVPPPTTTAPPGHTLPKPPPVETRPHTVTSTPAPPAATVDSATGRGFSSGSTFSSGSSPTAIGTAPAAHRASRRSKTSLAVSRFHLARPATVRVTVWEEAPQCRFFGRFTFAAARGTNALRLPRRIAKHALVVGRYRLVGLVHARKVIDERVRVERAKGRLLVRKIHASDGCIPLSEESILSTALVPRPGVDRGRGGGSTTAAGTRGTFRPPSAPTSASGPQSSKVLPQLSASVRHTLTFVLLALAIALLAVSSLPESTVRSGSAAAALAQHRAALTSAGLAMIVAAALALVLT
jgi:hypothetical protein